MLKLDPLPAAARRSPGVLIVVENLPVPFDRRVWQEALALKEAGFAVAVICPKGKGHTAAYECIAGVHIYRHPLPEAGGGALGYLVEYGSALFWEALLSLRVLRRHGFDVLHACNPPDLIFLIGHFYKLLGKRFLFDHHDICPELYEAKFGRRDRLHRLLGWLERATFRAADATLATNDTFKRIAVIRGGMKPEWVWVVRSFPDLATMHRVPPSAELRAGYRHLVGYVGIMGSQDGVDGLLRAMRRILDSGRGDVGCLIVGDGPELANLKRLAAELRLDGHVRFCGYLSGAALLRALSSMDIGVIPDPSNSYNDKISMNKVFEYMALGIPFVQYRLPESQRAAGAAAVTVGGDNADALAEAMLGLLDDPEKRRRMSAYGSARARHECRWEAEKDKLLEAYRFLLEDAAPAPATRRRTAAVPER